MNRILNVLPPDHGSTPCAGEVKERLVRPSPGDIIAADPLEPRTLGRDSGAPQVRFDVLCRADFGGTLLQFCSRISRRTSRRTTPRTSRFSI